MPPIRIISCIRQTRLDTAGRQAGRDANSPAVIPVKEVMKVKTTAHEVCQFIKENDVKFIRLGFCDLFGTQKNISIMADALPEAFEHGVSFDASAIRGFRSVAQSDLLLFPDPSTLSILPWRPGPGRVVRFYCDIRNPDGSPYEADSRSLLQHVAERCEAMGYVCKIGAECEFYLFKTDDNGDPSVNPLDQGGYFDISPLDQGENIRREICLCLEEMGLSPESSHHERGPGQNEIDFKYRDALTSADHLLTFKSVVKAIAARNGLFASFMPRPLPRAAGSGLHVNLSLAQNGRNIFTPAAEGHSAAAEHFIAGVLAHAPEMTLFLNPLSNSYERLGRFEAPRYVSWSHQNRSQLVRIPAATGERTRMELRSPDPSVNPYLAFALIIAAGLAGIEQQMKLPPAVDEDLFTADADITRSLTALPETLCEAVTMAQHSRLAASVLGETLLARYIRLKKDECEAWRQAADQAAFERSRYFTVT